ncbi:adenylyl-sulfate kinase [Pelagicoccus sp. NFK12]|uniref:Adenylyl-sulfate kinase n=1 Tax=Pelagicoccus enzymogenes TaxID=2773457 RepID=A0A927F6M2_9BACT|nr:adenylyl-sulfate kinase [Pelagicoccus enzymogenes]MBD5779349.1 adenylyl-sulfate kinase [Pelagicoccus enzymogenes]MDQ8198299.1 adenylyl-sulfate kinase [Pelagicoccus enzymogenes]
MDENLHPISDRLLNQADREASLGQKGKVVWLCGLSGSGKSTLAIALEKSLHQSGKHVYVLDGDNIRTGLNAGLGFSDEDRRENIRRIAEVSKLFADAGMITLNSFITPSEELRSLAREIIGKDNLIEVYVKASFETCKQRDVKGLYAKMEKGLVPNFTGKDSGFEEPKVTDLVIDTEAQSVEESLQALVDFVAPRVERGE